MTCPPQRVVVAPGPIAFATLAVVLSATGTANLYALEHPAFRRGAPHPPPSWPSPRAPARRCGGAVMSRFPPVGSPRRTALAAPLAFGGGQFLRGLWLQHRDRGPAPATGQLPPLAGDSFAVGGAALPGGAAGRPACQKSRPGRAASPAAGLDLRLHARHLRHGPGTVHRYLRHLPGDRKVLPGRGDGAGMDDDRRGAAGEGAWVRVRLRLAGDALRRGQRVVGHPLRHDPAPKRNLLAGAVPGRGAGPHTGRPAAPPLARKRPVPRRQRARKARLALVGDAYAGQFGAWPTGSGFGAELFPTALRALGGSAGMVFAVVGNPRASCWPAC